MALAATFAGMGFGNAGVHVPHCQRLPDRRSRPRLPRPTGYPGDEPLVPHGMSVALTAPEAFRFTYAAGPDRHLKAARLLDPRSADEPDGPDTLPDVLLRLMRDIGIPPGVGAVGYTDHDVPDLVEGAMKQQRLLAIAPCQVTEDDVAGIFRGSMTLW
jgi:alcohol dehydrogenase class IV